MPETPPSTRITRKDEDSSDVNGRRRDIVQQGIGEQMDDGQPVGEGVGFAAEPPRRTTEPRARSNVSAGSGAGQT